MSEIIDPQVPLSLSLGGNIVCLKNCDFVDAVNGDPDKCCICFNIFVRL